MKLTRKLTAALILGILSVLALNAAWRVRRELALFERDSRRDSLLIARMLAGSVGRVWPSLGEAQALDLVEDANQRESAVRIRWVWLDEPLIDPESPGGREVAFPRAPDPSTSGDVVQWVREDGDTRTLYTLVPVAVPGGRPGAVEVRDSLVDERLYVRRTIYQALVTTTILVLLCGAIAMGLGVVLVGTPVKSLIEQARRVGRGDLSARLRLSQRDEVGELAAEMNTMCDLLAQANERAARETSERIAALEQLRHAERLSTVGQLAAGIAHELGTPLNVILGRSQLVQKASAPDEETYKNATIVMEQAKRMTAIIRQLLDFARRGETHKSPERPHQLAQQTLNMLVPLAEKSSVRLALSGDETLEVEVDGGQLQQALTNLLVNAIQATAKGGVVKVEVGRRVDPSSPTARARLFLSVADGGPGISPVIQERLFEPFFTTKPAGEGTGLGLSVAYGIVKEHEGDIEVSSEPGKGSRFTIWLPEGRS